MSKPYWRQIAADYMIERDALRAKLEASERAAAEMRAVLESLHQQGGLGFVMRKNIEHSISSEAGRDYVSRSEVDAAWRKGMTDAAAIVRDICGKSNLAKTVLYHRDAKKDE